MEDIFLSTPVEGNKTLCFSTLSAKSYRDAGARGLGGDYGYFIYQVDSDQPHAGIEVIAKAASFDAAMRLYELLTVRDQAA
jgi:hypothetical protein